MTLTMTAYKHCGIGQTIIGLKNYSSAWVSRSTNQNCVIDHAKNGQHNVAMIQIKKASATSITEYSPIAQSLLIMEKEMQEHIKKKFDICYLMAKECILLQNTLLSTCWKKGMVWTWSNVQNQGFWQDI